MREMDKFLCPILITSKRQKKTMISKGQKYLPYIVDNINVDRKKWVFMGSPCVTNWVMVYISHSHHHFSFQLKNYDFLMRHGLRLSCNLRSYFSALLPLFSLVSTRHHQPNHLGLT